MTTTTINAETQNHDNLYAALAALRDSKDEDGYVRENGKAVACFCGWRKKVTHTYLADTVVRQTISQLATNDGNGRTL